MGDHVATPTQTVHPWRATLRTTLEWVIGAAAMAPLIYQAITESDPAAATGWAAVALGITAAVTRVAALPAVNALLSRIGLGATPNQAN